MLNFLSQATRAYETVGENIKGYDNYEFQVLKDLVDPLKSFELEELKNAKEKKESPEEGQESLIDIGEDGGPSSRSLFNGSPQAAPVRRNSRDSLERLLFGLDSPDRKAPPAPRYQEILEPGERSLIEADEVLRVESPLGIVEFDDPIDSFTPTKTIGPLPMLSEIEKNVEIPKLAPPSGWENKKKEDGSLISLDSSPAQPSSAFSTWSPFAVLNAQGSNSETPTTKSEFVLPSNLLDSTPNSSAFPNPFSGPEKNWTDLLSELEQFNTRTDTSGC